MTFDLPPIVKSAERLLLDINLAVHAFPHRDKYRAGEDLRGQAAMIVRLCNRAWRDHPRQLEWTTELVWAIDEVKATLRLCKDLESFRSFATFEALIRMAEDIGRQAGGWKRQQEQQHPERQNATRRHTAPQRAQTLGTRTASAHAGANP